MINIQKKILQSRAGFTLLELLVVMVILVLLASVVSVVVVKRVEEAKHAKAVADIESLGNAVDQFYLHCGRHPVTDESLDALRTKPQSDELQNWSGPYITKPVPLDPWGRKYVYNCPGDHNTDSYDIYSLGRDGSEGGDGPDADISNWE
ncbi:MAG: type II secretion system major pseudopilin GspG [Armatimonadota bacterium]